MKTVFAIGRQKQSPLLAMMAVCVLAAGSLGAQSVRPRIQAEINTNEPSVLKGSLPPLAQSRFDAGRMPAATELHGMEIVFNRSAAQQADLQALIQAQQDPHSAQFHKWLTPEEFGARFGMSDADIAKVESWLESEGFKIDSVNRAKTGIRFSGAAGNVERAFATEMHFYKVNGEKHYAPSKAISVPAAMAGVVTGVWNLHDFRPKPLHIRGAKMAKAHSQYTLNNNGDQYVFFAPGDIKVAYDMNSVIGAGYDGTGQVIAIMGQSAIQNVDIENFQQAAGLTVKDPTVTLVPGTGDSTLNPGCSGGGSYSCGGDEGESDLDIEWASAMAPGATINFVYTGGTLDSNGDPEYGVYDSYQYAVDNKIGNIISMSYGTCETEFADDQTDYNTLESIGQQAVAQGQSVVAASGDQGSTACSGYTDLTTAQQDALTVNYPASSAYVTGVGGTEISSADAQVGTYWTSTGTNTTLLTSATQYIPEVAWNDDDSQYGISASGGGASTLAARPSWQTGVTGIPSGSYRLVPDVSLYSSPNYPGYLYCTSDESDWYAGGSEGSAQTASCGETDGSYEFYDNQTGYFTIAGGTSFAAPIFAGMLAIVNQAKGYSTGQGLANVELYQLAANSTTYATAFHDVTNGDNDCSAGSSYCGSQTGGFSAGTGYDEVTGLGSVDLANLVTAYVTSPTVATATAVTASSTTPAVSASDTFTITVSSAMGTAPSGSVSVSVDGGTATSYTLTNGTASFSQTFTTAGTHTVTASFAATSNYAASTGTVTVTVGGSSGGTPAIKAAATPSTLTVAQGSSGTENVAVTGSGGYKGTVTLNVDFGSADSDLGNLCYGWGTSGSSSGTVTISSANGSGSTSLQLSANASDCLSSDAAAASQTRQWKARLAPNQLKKLKLNKLGSQSRSRSILPEGVAFAGLLLIGFIGRRSRKLRGLVMVLMLATVGMAISACGSSSGSSAPSNPPKGTYTGTITATDNATSTITSTTTFTFVID